MDFPVGSPPCVERRSPVRPRGRYDPPASTLQSPAELAPRRALHQMINAQAAPTVESELAMKQAFSPSACRRYWRHSGDSDGGLRQALPAIESAADFFAIRTTGRRRVTNSTTALHIGRVRKSSTALQAALAAAVCISRREASPATTRDPSGVCGNDLPDRQQSPQTRPNEAYRPSDVPGSSPSDRPWRCHATLPRSSIRTSNTAGSRLAIRSLISKSTTSAGRRFRR